VILLLDAHAVLWGLADDPTLADDARAAIAASSNEVLVSAATVWEIEIKRALGKLSAPDNLVDAIDASGFSSIPIVATDAERAGRLPAHHRDPFDRMLVAQALRVDAVIISRDAVFEPYGIAVLTA
jgi:PIN domain nuclease of toxin-antitoxin system